MTDEAPHTPTSATAVAAPSSNGFINSPHSRRQSLPSPWASVVRGESESPAAAVSSPPQELDSALDNPEVDNSGSEAQSESFDVNGDSNAGRPRRPAWNRPVNGVVKAGPVMGGAVSWPALSESARLGPRSGPDSTRPVSEGLASSSQVPIIFEPPQRTVVTNAHPHPHPHPHPPANNTTPNRGRSRNRGGGSGGGSRGSSSGSVQPQSNFNWPTAPIPPPFPVFEVPYGMAPPMIDTPVRSPRPGGGSGGSQPHTGNDHYSPRNTSRRGNFGAHPRGDGPYNNNHSGRRDQDRRDVHIPPQYVPPPMGYMQAPLPPGAGPFMPPPPVRVFPGQMGFEMAHPFFYHPPMPSESFRAMPMVLPPPSVPFPTSNENLLTSMIVRQIDYYFSDYNLVKDNYLKSNMDENGWVPIALIASFPRVQHLTTDVSVILDALKYSAIVEMQGDKLRRRGDWNRWLRSSSSANNESSSNGLGVVTPGNSLATSLQGVSLNDSMTNANGNVLEVERQGHTETNTGGLLAEELTNGEDTVEEVLSSTE